MEQNSRIGRCYRASNTEELDFSNLRNILKDLLCIISK